jgi:hypothetical protein
MRRPAVVAAIAVALLVAGCEKYTWDRPGVSDEATQADYRDCRQQAQTEAFRTYAFYSGFPIMGPGYWGYRAQPDYWFWRQRIDSERFFYENRLTNFCMRNKGYTLVKVEDDVQAVPSNTPQPPVPAPPQRSEPVRR